ncbi:MAG: hypothetical protein GC203_13080 [Phenylobacterium sp.]|uniref:hypothetical protein n=1 Tax=Phenylobacterium sp. TaxID=1871053 RepID=UPI0025EB847F|nr:hypothetical protein [Phenylobacterium sp.]MBI1198787.1 hypothetical protein [Phenylobacterium sp.]
MLTTTADADDFLGVLRPFLLLACIGFAAGFLGYWALAQMTPAGVQRLEPAQPAVLTGPMADPDNPPRLI